MKRPIVLAWLIFSLPLISNAQWVQTNGPEGGEVRSLAAVGQYVLAARTILDPGVYRTSNGGATWERASTGLQGLAVYVKHLVANDSLVFAGTFDGVYRSSNWGSSWVKTNDSLIYDGARNIGRLAIHGSTLYSGLSTLVFDSVGGVYVSSDWGDHWERRSTGLPGNQYVRCLLPTDSGLFVGLNAGLYRSRDSGQTWISLANAPSGQVNDIILSDTILYAGGNNLYKSTDYGENWTIPVMIGTSGNTVYALLSGDTLFAGTWAGVYRSTDGGTSWIRSDQGMISIYGANAILRVDTLLYSASGYGGVHRSGNGGVSWTPVNSGFNGQILVGIAAAKGVLYAGSSGSGLFRSTNSGHLWTQAAGAPKTFSYGLFVKDSTVLCTLTGSGSSNGLYRSSDAGITWSLTTGPQAFSFVASGDSLYAGWVGVYRSTDDGITWTMVSVDLPATAVNTIEPKGGLLFVGTNRGIFRSSNAGVNWTPMSNGLGQDTVIRSLVAMGSDLYGVGVAHVYRSTNLGVNWIAFNGGLPSLFSPTAIVASGQSLFLGTQYAGVFLSYAGGPWRSINNGFPEGILYPSQTVYRTVQNFTVFEGRLWAALSIGGVVSGPLEWNFATITPASIDFGSVNVGFSAKTPITVMNIGNDTVKVTSVSSTNAAFSVQLQAFNVPPGQSVNDTIVFTPAGAGSLSGLIFIQSNADGSPDTVSVTGAGTTVSGVEGSEDIPREFSLSQNYPNPFNPSTIIRYGLPERSSVKLEVYDLLGRVVTTLVDGEQEARFYEVSWQANVPSGIYFYRIAATALNDPSKSFVQVKKMLMLK